MLINNAGEEERQGLHIALHESYHADRKECVFRNQHTDFFALRVLHMQYYYKFYYTKKHLQGKINTLDSAVFNLWVKVNSSSFHIGQ